MFKIIKQMLLSIFAIAKKGNVGRNELAKVLAQLIFAFYIAGYRRGKQKSHDDFREVWLNFFTYKIDIGDTFILSLMGAYYRTIDTEFELQSEAVITDAIDTITTDVFKQEVQQYDHDV